MPRSVIVISGDPNLFASASGVLCSAGTFAEVDGEIQSKDPEAQGTAIYPVTLSDADWDGWDSGPTEVPDPRTLSTLIFEARSPHMVAEVGRLLAHGISEPVWFVDAADQVWAAGRVSSEQITLA